MPPRPRVAHGIFDRPDALGDRLLARPLWPDVDFRANHDVALCGAEVVLERSGLSEHAVGDVGEVFRVAGNDLRGVMMVAVEEVAIPDIDVNRVVLSDDAPGGAAVIEIATPEPAEDFPRQELRPDRKSTSLNSRHR